MKISAVTLVEATLLIALLGTISFAQDPTDNQKELSTVPIALKCRPNLSEPQAIRDEAELKTLMERPGMARCRTEKLEIDFQKYTLIAVSVFADCHARVAVRVTSKAKEKLYEVTVSEKYGGCRGMDLHNRWVLVEKLPPGYTVQFKAIQDKDPRD